MKFTHLNIGQKFEFEGNTYVKTSPLLANDVDSGKNRMIPRYANLKLLNDNPADETSAAGSAEKTVRLDKVKNLFGDFYQTCHNHCSDTKEIEQARDDFLRQLED